MKAEDLHSFCNHILESDRSIRFVGIRNKTGNQIIKLSCWNDSVIDTRGDRNVRYAVSITDEYQKCRVVIRVDWSNILGLNF